MLKPDDFCYVDLAIGDFRNRNRIVHRNDVAAILLREIPEEKVASTEVYTTAYRYTEDILQYIESNKGSVEGYNGACSAFLIPIDVDFENVEDALKETRHIVHQLVEHYEISPKWLRYWFSGSKGFHIGIVAGFANAYPSVDFAQTCRRFVKSLVGEARVDLKIYNTMRLWRVENTVNRKSFMKKEGESWVPVEGKVPLYKVPLYADEILFSTIEEILKIAEHPRKDFTLEEYPREILPKIAKVWESALAGEPKVEKKLLPDNFNEKKVNRNDKYCMQVMYREMTPPGDRNEVLMVLADNFKKTLTLPEEMAEGMLFAKRDYRMSGTDRPTDKEIHSIVERIYNPDSVYDYGCNTPVMASRCCRDTRCKWWNKEDKNQPDEHLFNIVEAAKRYQEMMTDTKTPKINLGFRDLDRKMRGILPGQLVNIMARSSVGKTRMLMNILANYSATTNGGPAMFFSLEQPIPEVYEGYAARTSYVGGVEEVEHAYVSGSQKAKQIQSELETTLPNLIFCDKDRVTIDQMKEYVFAAQRKYGIEHFPLIAVDYLGRMDGRGVNEYQIVSSLAINLKQFAKEMNTVVIMIHQTGRAEGGVGANDLTLASGRGSGVVEEASDFIIALSRPDMEIESQTGTVIYNVKAQLLKNRRGIANFFTFLRYNGPKATFEDVRDDLTAVASIQDSIYQ